MQFRDYWQIFRKRWWLIVIVAAAACGVSYAYAKVQTPLYRSEVQLSVAPSRLDYGLTLVIDNLLTQYQMQLSSRHLAEEVDRDLKLDRPVDSLLAKVKVQAVSNGYFLDLTVDDTDPNNARDIAYQWAERFIEEHQADMAPLDPQDRIEIKMLDQPLPGAVVFPKTKQYVLAAGVLGVVVGALLAFLLEYLDDTLKAPDDVERFLGLPVVGAVPLAAGFVTTATSNGHAKTGVTGGRRLWQKS